MSLAVVNCLFSWCPARNGPLFVCPDLHRRIILWPRLKHWEIPVQYEFEIYNNMYRTETLVQWWPWFHHVLSMSLACPSHLSWLSLHCRGSINWFIAKLPLIVTRRNPWTFSERLGNPWQSVAIHGNPVGLWPHSRWPGGHRDMDMTPEMLLVRGRIENPSFVAEPWRQGKVTKATLKYLEYLLEISEYIF